ncbi:putative integral membrane protein [Theileria parva strain Muguga]|uniref:Tash1 protein, putative n=1 Tax=Theileria parva TaxID=5875 RepID=Q4N854_THEPA|nr:uncharacterized protein TpMuguga_01g00616 [Theileria parva strain Muguga]EAN33854.1 putative integral membrane protein [Theileria parva strain Muguga]|eukprot:XP_766137.1 hypothetical protein [Theileria parva strain Muguga]
MIYLKNTFLIFVVFVYCIKIASSLTLDLNNTSMSEFHTLKLLHQGIAKTIVLSTPDRQITEVRQGRESVWMGHPGESIKCVTFYISFKWSSEVLMTIEINNPNKTAMYYLRKHHHNYKYISLQEFESRYRDMVILSKQLDLINEQNIREKELVRKTKQKQPKKRKAETDDTGEPEKKIRRQPNETTEQQPLVPETIHFEISDSEEEHEIKLEISDDEQHEPPGLSHFKKPTQPSQPLVPETTQVELGSDEDTLTTNLIGEPLFEEGVQMMLETELKDLGLSEIDALFEEQSDFTETPAVPEIVQVEVESDDDEES